MCCRGNHALSMCSRAWSQPWPLSRQPQRGARLPEALVRTRVPPTWRWPVAHLSPHVHRAGCCRDCVFCAPSALTGPMVAPPRAGSTGPSRRPTPTRSRSNGRSSSATKRSIAVQAQRPDLPAARRRRPSPPARRPRNMGRRKLQRWINGTRPRERARVCAAEPSVAHGCVTCSGRLWQLIS